MPEQDAARPALGARGARGNISPQRLLRRSPSPEGLDVDFGKEKSPKQARFSLKL